MAAAAGSLSASRATTTSRAVLCRLDCDIEVSPQKLRCFDSCSNRARDSRSEVRPPAILCPGSGTLATRSTVSPWMHPLCPLVTQTPGTPASPAYPQFVQYSIKWLASERREYSLAAIKPASRLALGKLPCCPSGFEVAPDLQALCLFQGSPSSYHQGRVSHVYLPR